MNAQEAIQKLVDRANASEVIFPTTAEMAMKIQRMVDDPDCSVEQLAHMVQADPLLAARVVAVANSVIYNRFGLAAANIRTAVSRIGFRTLQMLAASVVIRQMENLASTPEHRKMARQLWEYTIHVAALAELLARKLTRQDPETAFFAGIVHEVGGFYLIACAGDFPGLLEGEDGSLSAWTDGGAATLGHAVLQRLDVPIPVMVAIEGLWEGELASPPVSLSDTLLLARRLTPAVSPLDRLVGNAGAGTNGEIDPAANQATLRELLNESEEEVASLVGALYD